MMVAMSGRDSVSHDSEPMSAALEASPVPGAGGVVFDRAGRVLVIGSRDGVWLFPKGHLEDGETAQDAALREVEEEAGVDARRLPDTPTWTTEYANRLGVPRRITWFACTTDAEQPRLRERGFPRGGFFAPDEALDRLTHEVDRVLLRSVLTTVLPALGAAP